MIDGKFTVTLLVMDDGRPEYLVKTMESMTAHIAYQFDHALLVNDSGNTDYAAWLERTFPSFRHIHHSQRIGFAQAIRSAWSHLPKSDYLFTLEADYVFNSDIDIPLMACILESNERLSQLVLKRQAWNSNEIAAGGIIEQHSDWYTEYEVCGATISEHTLNYSTNPNLMRYSLTHISGSSSHSGEVTWPNESESEGKYGAWLREQGYSFAFLGKKTDAPLVEHIGVKRAGNGY